MLSWETSPELDVVEAACSYAGIRHRRRVAFDKPQRQLTITDVIEGNNIECLIEQFWHPGEAITETKQGRWSIGERAELAVDPSAQSEMIESWQSDAPASKRAASAIRVWVKATLPVELTTTLCLPR